MKNKLLRYRYSENKSPYSAIHCEVATRYDPDRGQLTHVSIVHDETQFRGNVEITDEDVELLNIQYPFYSNRCPTCAEHRPVMIWTGDQIEPVSDWEEDPEVDVVRM